jgi:tetratricopeptide (TPR) repeat protein
MAADLERYIAGSPAPEDWREYANRARAFHMLGRPEQGLTDANHALDLCPREPTVLTARGHILADLGRHDDAVADLTAALAADPNPFCRAEANALLARLQQAATTDATTSEGCAKPA